MAAWRTEDPGPSRRGPSRNADPGPSRRESDDTVLTGGSADSLMRGYKWDYPTKLFKSRKFQKINVQRVTTSSSKKGNGEPAFAKATSGNPSFWLADLTQDRADKLGREYSYIQFKFESPRTIDAIYLLNKNIPFLSVLVGNSLRGDREPNKMLLRRDFRDFYHESDMVVGYATDKSHFFWEKNDDFKPEIHAQKWDLVRIICYQPYPIDMEYGLGFVEFAEDISDY